MFRKLCTVAITAALIWSTIALEASQLVYQKTGGARASALTLSGGLSRGYVSQVGGVSFNSVAKPAVGLEDKAIVGLYNKVARDGWRFTFSIGKENAVWRVPDWVAIPAIRFADLPYTAAYTLIGDDGP